MTDFIKKIKNFCCCCESSESDFDELETRKNTVVSFKEPIQKQIIKRKSISTSMRIQVWNNIFNDPPVYNAKCPICQENEMVMSNGKSWEVSHVEAHSKGGDSELDNLKPICRKCNRSMGNTNMITFIKKKSINPENVLKKLKINSECK